MRQKLVYSVDQLPSVIQKLKAFLGNCSVITLTGPLGAGKTTLVKALLQNLGVKEWITSPTFTYLNQYENESGRTFYHFDLHRIESLQDFRQAGFEEYLYQPNSLTIIEWPEPILSLLTHNACHLELSYHDDPSKRTLEISVDNQ